MAERNLNFMKRMTQFWAFIKKLAGLVGFNGDKIEVGNDLEVDGKLKAFENITDAHDRQRFIEGNITIPTISGITSPYARWSLSGSHLMVVLTYSFEANSTLASSDRAIVNVPEWILNKIYPTGIQRVITTSFGIYGKTTNQVISTAECVLTKQSSSSLEIFISGTTRPEVDANIRMQFDLLIDNAN